MGLFKDFKEDWSQAINELVPGGEAANDDNLEVDTLGENVDVQSELSKLDGLLEQVKETPVAEPADKKEKKNAKETKVEKKEEAPVVETASAPVEEKVMDTTVREERPVVLDETSVITASTTLTGNLASAGSFDIQGTVNGNVTCNGKLVVTGTINGNSTASEFFADVAKVEGEVVSTGTVKIGAGSVIIGNISATSAVIAGAVKGDIDVQGPVVVDTSAVIMGNIKSRSVQINNGAIIEGFCSQCYAEIDVQGLFG